MPDGTIGGSVAWRENGVEYPLFELPVLGGPMLIAGIAILHVYIAQFSIGAAFFMAWAERRAIRRGDPALRDFLRRYAFLVLVVPYVLGTATGAGIWFAISVVSPRATSLLVHQFVWAWAAEWVLFCVEVVCIYLYFYTWDRVRPEVHNRIGWAFAAASWLTLPLINAILSFMLTPGAWRPGDPWAFWLAVANPLWLPTTFIRTLISLALGGVGALALAAFARDAAPPVRQEAARLAHRMILPVWLCLPLAGWAFAVLPARAQAYLAGGSPVMQIFLGFGMALFVILAGSSLVAMWRRDYTPSPSRAILLALVAFVAYGSLEFVREGVRKPFVIDGFMYSTGVTTGAAEGLDRRAAASLVQQRGVLAAAPWALPQGQTPADLDPVTRGRAVYKAACRPCHAVDGYNAVRPLVRTWSRADLENLLDRMSQRRPMMPPFPGTADEKSALAAYLESLGNEVRR